MKNGLDFVPDVDTGPFLSADAGPTFGQTVGASLSFKYTPLLNRIQEASDFGFRPLPQDGYAAIDNIPNDLREYGGELLRATSPAHMDLLVSGLRRNLTTRQTLAESGFGVSMAAEVFDPINWGTLPFAAGKTFLKAAARGGASTTALVAGQEAARYASDPLATVGEVALTLGSSFILGGTLHGLTTIPSRRRIQAQENGAKEIERLREAIEPLDGVEIDPLATADPSIAENIFTDSWLFKAVTTPMKRTLQDKDIPNSVKLTMLDIANDSGILLAANKKGIAFKNSVFQNAKLRDGEWVQTYDSLVNIWGESTGRGVTQPADYMYKRTDFEDWLTDVDSKAMRGEKPASDFESRAMENLNTFYSKWESRLSERGLIGNKSFYIRDIAKRQARNDDITGILARKPNMQHRDVLEDIVQQNKSIMEQHQLTIKSIDESGPVKPANEEIFRPRYWDKDSIRKDRAGLEAVLKDWFRNNPEGYGYDAQKRWTKVTYATSDAAIAKRASDAVDNILGMKDVTDFDVASFGHGKSKHLKHRGIDIPNKLVMDYMHRNPVSIMKAYTTRTAARYEFAVKFDGQEIDDVLNDKMAEMLESGMTLEKANAALKDMRHMYDRVAGVVIREPDTYSQTSAYLMRMAAQLNYLGSAGLSTITEPSRIIMEHGLGPTMKGLFGALDDSQLKMGAKEARIAGEALEILMGSSHLRLVEDMGNNPLRPNVIDKANNAFFLLNGLAPATRILKDFEGMMRSHTLIDYSVRLAEGKATKMEVEYLARYNIDKDMAAKIAASPWEKGKSGLYMANTEAWSDAAGSAAPSKAYKPSGKSVLRMSEDELIERFRGEFYVDRIITDQEIVDDVFVRLGTPNILGHASGLGTEMPATVYVNFANLKSSYSKLKNREDLQAFQTQLDDALEDGTISDVQHTHQTQLVKNIDLIESEDDFAEFVLMHELHHTTTPQRVGEYLADYENRIDELAFSYVRNSREEGAKLSAEKDRVASLKDAEETVQVFRNALGSGIANTILMGTPADKPIITDGIVYIPIRVASQFGMKEDAKYKGYSRMESPLLGLPFQFMSYSLAAVNKTTAAFAHGQIKSQFIGTAMSLGLGYMLLQAKTPDYIEMNFSDKFARAFDYSGVAPLYSDLFYTSMGTALALGGPNITGNVLQPRFPQEPNKVDAATGILGAGPGITSDIARGLWELTTGNVGEGGKDVIRNLPFARLWFLKGKMNEMTRMLETELDGNSGFGRY